MAGRNADKKRKWQLPLQLLAVVLLSALLVGILATELARAADALQYEKAQEVTVPLRLEATGYLFYDAAVVKSIDLGPSDYRTPDGAAVEAGDMLAVVYADGAGAGTRERAREIVAEIERLQALDGSAPPPDYHGAYAALMKALSKENGRAVSGDIAEITDALALFAAQSESADARAEKIAALRAEFAELVKNDAYSTVTAAASGVFYRTVDGFEENMTAAVGDTLTVGALAALLASPQDTASAIGVVALEGVWHIAVTVSASQAALLSVGQTYTVDFAAAGAARALTLSRISDADAEGNCLLLLSGDGLPPTLDRRQQISFTYGERRGLLVPMAALSERDGGYGVYVRENGCATWRAVTPIYLENGYCLAESSDAEGMLRQGDSVLVTLRRIYEGKAL